MTDLLDRLRASINRGDKTKPDNKIIILGILFCVIILYIDFSFVIKPQLKGINTLGPKITKLKKDLKGLVKDLSIMEESKKGINKDKKQTAASKFKQIISEDNLPQLLKEIADLANTNKIKIMQINTASDLKVKEEVIAGGKFSPINITLNLSCAYHSVGSFINALENMQIFLSVEEMEIARDPKDYLQQKVKLVLKTYATK